MAEMTAEQAVNLLNSVETTSESNGRKARICVLLYESEAYPISELIEQQAQTIEAQAKRLEAAEKVCYAVLNTEGKVYSILMDAIDAWQQVKEGQ